MLLTMLKSKLHRGVVTDSDLQYEGSIGIDADLLLAANMLPNERVDVLNINNGQRFSTYVIEAKAGSGQIIVNGAAARLVQKGDLVIICAFAQMNEAEAKIYQPIIVQLDLHNKIKPYLNPIP
jgi:aspartate 1-decarboxylase